MQPLRPGDAQSPLAGLRILDLTQALAGPFASMILADLGADVVKVEPPRGDLTRTSPPHFVEETSIYFLTNNRNKRSITLNLKEDADRGRLEELVRRADVVFYNYRHGVAERLGLDHPSLSRINPRIITCNLTGYGTTGPEAAAPAVDLVVQAAAGAMSITGEVGRPPVRAGVPTADLSAGLYSVVGILAALVHRDRTGRGLEVATSLFHSQLSLLNYMATYAMFGGSSPGPVGSGHVGTVPSQAFETRDGWIVIDAGFDHHFRSLCEVLGREELADDERFRQRHGRFQHRTELVAQLEREIADRESGPLLAALRERGLPSAAVADVLTAVQSDQSRELGYVQTVPFGDEEVEVLATPLWLDGELPLPRRRPPLQGENADEVFSDWLSPGSHEDSERCVPSRGREGVKQWSI